MKKLMLLIFFLITLPSVSLGCEYSVRYLLKVPLPAGGIQTNEAGLQSPASNVSGSQFKFLCTLIDSRFLFGVGYDIEDKKYYLRDGVSREFEAESSSVYAKAGYSHIVRDGLNLEFGLRAGHGKIDFSESNTTGKKLSDIYSLGTDVKIVRAIKVKELKLEFLGGLSIQKSFVPDFHYNGRDFSSSEFGVSANFLVGIGISF